MHLELAVGVAKEAGALLREEFHRPGGPRGEGEHAEIDIEVERFIRRRLLEATPGYGYLGEETGAQEGGGDVWVVDPNDGTRDFLRGRRGSSVSIALLHEGEPVLGVVYSPMYPDDDGDLVAWKKGKPSPRRTGAPSVVLVRPGSDGRASLYSEKLHPFRYRPMPSVAYRLALAAAGEGVAAVGLHGPRDWDYAAGHALLLGAGAVLLDRKGEPVRYARNGESHARDVYGGPPEVVKDLLARDWESLELPALEGAPFVSPVRGRAHRDPGRLRRAQGCLLGQVAGDSLGSLVEALDPDEIRRRYPAGLRDLRDGGVWETIAGQPTDDSELAITLARSIVTTGAYRPDAALAAYRAWHASGPFDLGHTTDAALSGRALPESQANGSLMRISPLGVFGWNRDATELARADSALTHPHPVCRDASAAFVAAIAHGVANGHARGAYEAALHTAREAAVIDALRRAADGPSADFVKQQGWVLIALQNAFFRLLHSASFEDALVETVHAGGDTDTNAAIAGALLGAVLGREAIPFRWRQPVLTCRPLEGRPEVKRPRPKSYWPVDLLDLAEALMR